MKLTAKLLKKLIQEEVQKEGHYHDMGGEDEMYDALDIPKRLSPKEIFGEFQNFVEVNNLSREDIEGMVEMLFSGVMDVPLNESPSMEHITPENIKLVLDALAQVGMLLAPTAVAAAAIQKGLSKRVKKKKPEVKEGWYGYSKRGNWRSRKRAELEYELGDEDTRSHDPLRSFKRRAAIGRKTLNDMLTHLQSQGQGPGDEDYDFVKRKLDTSKWRKWYMKQDDYDRLAQLLGSELFNSEKNIQYKWAPWTSFKVG